MSMPTPRPEMSETTEAVEKPDAKISMVASWSLIASDAACVRRPFLMAAALILAGSMPPPSSVRAMTMWFSSCRAASVTRPCAGLPAATRTSGVSMP